MFPPVPTAGPHSTCSPGSWDLSSQPDFWNLLESGLQGPLPVASVPWHVCPPDHRPGKASVLQQVANHLPLSCGGSVLLPVPVSQPRG